ncbi:MAG: c-type cytochrome [Chthoniobacter sp.]
MKVISIRALRLLPQTLTLPVLIVAGCMTVHPSAPATYQQVVPLLENNCVHCHGQQRLPSMPPLTDTAALAALIGPGKLIVPGHPEDSRFLRVVTLADNQVGAMPPTGHAISPREVELMRAWIANGAPLPAVNVDLTPRGRGPRSR